MQYSVNKLSKLSGVSARTLRYYDEIGLLKPMCVAVSGYRSYGQAEVDRLQQILFYRELGFPLEAIKGLLTAPAFDRGKAFAHHLKELYAKRTRLDLLIANVVQSAAAMKGESEMTDQEKFTGFKQSLIDENERQYGAEIREKYGDAAVDESNAHLMEMTPQQYDAGERLRALFEATLKEALVLGEPAGEAAQQACDLHRQWLGVYTPNYSKDYHRGLGELYVADHRFRAYYDDIAPGCAEFLRDAIAVYCA